MRLWIEEKAYLPDQISLLQDLVSDHEWLDPVVSFLKFWYSDESHFKAKTSGSTGTPKTIEISREKLEISAKSTIQFFQFDNEKEGLVLCISAKHVGGFMILARGILADLDIWLLPPSSFPIPESSPMLNTLSWFISVVPLQLENIAASQKICEASKEWKGILVGGAGLSISQLKSVSALQCPVYQSYGMTETVSHIAVRQVSNNQEQPYEVLPGNQIRMNEDDCLEIKSAITNNEWLGTNDRVEISSETTFKYLGRKDDIINSGGIKVDPVVITEAISTFLNDPSIEFLVLGIPDERYGQKVVAIFVANPILNEIDLDKMIQYLKTEVDPRTVPKAIFQLDTIPLLPNMKTNKLLLVTILQSANPVWVSLS